jgi:Flavodoxin reductases (ferredoxin-NADPH reductases) family 1
VLGIGATAAMIDENRMRRMGAPVRRNQHKAAWKASKRRANAELNSVVTQESAIETRLVQVRYEALGVLSYIFRGTHVDLPDWTPGSHVKVFLPKGVVRSYSLSNVNGNKHEYRITVQKDANSRGGSLAMHSLQVGGLMHISAPKNDFPLDEKGAFTTFVAGGIGVTPFLPMAARLNELGRRWRLYYSVRTPERAAHIDELRTLAAAGGADLEINFDGVPGGRMLNLSAIIGEIKPDGHIYCCGPDGMLDTFRREAEILSPDRVHFEYFGGQVEVNAEGGFTVVLARSGREVTVERGQTILQAVRKLGVEVTTSCETGVCAACETRVLEGIPDHRDMILSKRERQEGKVILICCSGSKTDRIVLDL